MKTKEIGEKKYNLPGSLSSFQQEMYVHLINWKWKNITDEKGIYNYKGTEIEYDAILPQSIRNEYPLIYPSILEDLKLHRKKIDFKLHLHFHHMASSQAANVNLFLPILLHPHANEILRIIKSDFNRLATSELYKGFQIEYWGGNSKNDKGFLKDHSPLSGTDSDIAIAYYNQKEELCLWLIEHKLTEKEFTACSGCKSKDRNNSKHKCDTSFSELMANKNSCFHHSFKKREYWNLTAENQSFFVNHSSQDSCPFKGGMNQLWRNQLLGFALEKAGTFKETFFSVVKHPENEALEESINQYKFLIGNNTKFSVFNSTEVINAARTTNNIDLNKWIQWYKELYKI
jgi:hypothetical protein